MDDYSIEVDSAILRYPWESYEETKKKNDYKRIYREIYEEICEELANEETGTITTK